MKWLVFCFAAIWVGQGAFAGNELGNGGDSVAQEFVAIGRKVADRIRVETDPSIPADAFLAAVESTAVSTHGHLELRGVEVDAINYPESKRIEVNRARWREYGIREKASLVFHEYLGIAGVDDSNYRISGKYVEVPSPLFFHTNSEPATFSRVYSDLDDNPNRQFFAGLGTGYYTAGGNLGKLYGGEQPSIEARVGYNLGRLFTARASVGSSSYSYIAPPVGSVDLDLIALGLAGEFHFLGNPRVEGRRGFDPYLFAGADQVFRSQNFQTYGTVEKDNAYGANGGVGVGYFFSRRMVAGIEARISKVFFRDQYEQIYLMAGIPDTTGFFYGGTANIRYFF